MKNLACLVVIFALTASGSAQTMGATNQGTISDPSGAVLPGMQIVVKNIGTGTAKQVSQPQCYHRPLLRLRKICEGQFPDS